MRTIVFMFILLCSMTAYADDYVQGYCRSNGTCVDPYYRTAPNYTNDDNYSTKGNVNPYHGKPGYITPDNRSRNYGYSTKK